MKRSYKYFEKMHYDNKIKENINKKNYYDIILSNAHDFFESQVDTFINKQPEGGGKILDYGCGTGARTIKFASAKWKLFGIDISTESINIANRNGNNNTSFYVMDCEKMIFPDNYFDLIIDYGTFSSLNVKNAIPEMIRTLKPNGAIIAIETLGHNPIANLKRKINVWKGYRTKWASEHIMRIDNWKWIKKQFKYYQFRYFGLISLFLKPFIKYFPVKIRNSIIIIFQELDDRLLEINFFKKYAFKTVVTLKNPKK